MNRKSLVRNLHTIVMIVCACALTASAQGSTTGAGARAADEAALRENVRQMEEGWNQKSGAAFARPFAEDADYVVINGMYLRGRAAIAEAHQRIFDTFYKETTVSLHVKQLRFLRPDVAVVHVNAARTAAPQAPAARALLTLVMLKDAGAWKITAFQNTQVAQQP
jgi:uncharacterized protein (TIGR02246 family)